MAKETTAVEKTPEEPKKKYRLIEITVDENITKIRRLIPAETEEEDIEESAEVFSVEETEIMLKRQQRPEIFLRGHAVRLRPTAGDPIPDSPVTGTVDAILKGKKLRIKWDNGTISRHTPEELFRIY